jgi:hypothetical protein
MIITLPGGTDSGNFCDGENTGNFSDGNGGNTDPDWDTGNFAVSSEI